MTTQVALDLVWAEGGGWLDPGDVKYVLGWTSEIPAFQFFNYVLKNTTQNIRYLAEAGSFVHEVGITYSKGGMSWEGTYRYQCIVDASLNEVPSITPQSWTRGQWFGSNAGLAAEYGLHANYVVESPGAQLWEGSDVTIQNNNPVVQLLSDNLDITSWLIHPTTQGLAVTNIDNVSLPDDRDISPAGAQTYQLYHEGAVPPQISAGDAAQATYTDNSIASLKALMYEAIFPIGSFHIHPDPNGVIPGTWVQPAEGTFLQNTVASNDTGGGANNKTLLDSEIPSHSHNFTGNALAPHSHTIGYAGSTGGSNVTRADNATAGNISGNMSYVSGGTPSGSISATGGGSAFDNRPKYRGVPIWERTA